MGSARRSASAPAWRWCKKASRGERVSRHLPYGQRLSADGAHLVTDDAEAATIARARSLRARGMSLTGNPNSWRSRIPEESSKVCST
jgi:hypothetical protein